MLKVIAWLVVVWCGRNGMRAVGGCGCGRVRANGNGADFGFRHLVNSSRFQGRAWESGKRSLLSTFPCPAVAATPRRDLRPDFTKCVRLFALAGFDFLSVTDARARS